MSLPIGDYTPQSKNVSPRHCTGGICRSTGDHYPRNYPQPSRSSVGKIFRRKLVHRTRGKILNIIIIIYFNIKKTEKCSDMLMLNMSYIQIFQGTESLIPASSPKYWSPAPCVTVTFFLDKNCRWYPPRRDLRNIQILGHFSSNKSYALGRYFPCLRFLIWVDCSTHLSC